MKSLFKIKKDKNPETKLDKKSKSGCLVQTTKKTKTGKKETKKYYLSQEDKNKMLENKERLHMLDFINTTSKLLIWFFTINGSLWIWCSYALAFFGKDQIAESLSSNVCIVIIGQLVTYFITKTIENVFRYNGFGGQSSYSDKQLILNSVQVPEVSVPDISSNSNIITDISSGISDGISNTLAEGGVTNNEEFSDSFN